MIIGSGIDLVEVGRLKEVAERWQDRFLKRVFTLKELDYSQGKKFPYQHLAARFAAKEAVLKSLGGIYPLGAFGFLDIEIRNGHDGKPEVVLLKKRKENVSVSIQSDDFILSMSHTKNWAVASVLVYAEEKSSR